MRRFLIGLVVVVGCSGLAGEARAQFGTANDPLFTYYGLYLPRQQAQALQQGPEASIAALSQNRQAYAATNRNEAFDTGGSRFDADGNDLGFNSGVRGGSGGVTRAARIGGNLNGLGPAKYYGARVRDAHPTLRNGLHRNYNMGTTKAPSRISTGGYGGVGTAGLPGPR